MSRPAVLTTDISVDEFMDYDIPDAYAELVRGEIRVSPWPKPVHGVVFSAIFKRLIIYVEDRQLGHVLANAGFEIVELPRTVRVPDIAFFRAGRFPAEGLEPTSLGIVPDLAVEVLSPDETRKRIREKLDDYRVARIPLVWLIDPRTRTVTVIQGDLPGKRLDESDVLDGGDVIPGFACEIRELFAALAKKK